MGGYGFFLELHIQTPDSQNHLKLRCIMSSVFKPDLFFRLSFCNCLSCVVTARIFLILIFHPQFKYMFHIFTFTGYSFIVHWYITNSQYDQLSSVGRALHRHRRGHGFESRSSLILFFRLSFRNCLRCVVTARIFLLFDLSSTVQIYVSYIYIYSFTVHGYITNSQYDQLPVGLKLIW